MQGYVMLPTPRPKGGVWAGTPRAPQGGGRPLDPRFWRALHSPGSDADVACVNRARDLLIIRAFDDGACIGIDRHLIAIDDAAQQKFVIAHLADGAQTLRQCREIEPDPVFAAPAGAGAHLYRVAPAQARAAGAGRFKEFVVMLAAGRAIGLARQRDALERVLPEIQPEQVAAHPLAFQENFDRFG